MPIMATKIKGAIQWTSGGPREVQAKAKRPMGSRRTSQSSLHPLAIVDVEGDEEDAGQDVSDEKSMEVLATCA